MPSIELKYLKLADADQVETVQAYLQHDKLRSLHELWAWIIVFVGPKAQVVLPVGTV